MNKAKKKNLLEPENLYFIPLGGSEQFGVNFNLYASGGDMLAVDCGIGFADERYPGIDIFLPDPAFAEENQEKLKGLIVTHAHEDHIGAVAYLWPRLRCPLYASGFTAAVLRRKLREEKLDHVPVHEIKLHESVQIGAFKVTLIPVAHSIPGTSSLIIETKQGRILHSGDWNLDPNPVIGKPTDGKYFKEAGKEGVLAYIGDSTNAQIPGRAGSESEVEKGLEKEFKKCKGRIAVTIFSSNIGRIQSIARAAKKNGRSVCVVGRSLHQMVATARECGYLQDIPDFVTEGDLKYMPDDKIVMIVTGSQGEPRAALSKIARGEFRGVSLNKGDTVIFSARAIPGNEKNINVVKNNLSAGGVEIVTPDDTENIIHVSGHPYQDEIAEMYGWLRPEIVIPVHGERTQLEAQAQFARQCQVKTALVPNNGSVIRLAPGKAEIVDHVQTGLLAMDERRIIPADHASIVERRKLQYSGVVQVSLVLDGRGDLAADPRLDTLGLFDESDEADRTIEDDLYNEIINLLEKMSGKDLQDDEFVEEELRIGLRRFVNKILGIKPKTTVQLMRI